MCCYSIVKERTLSLHDVIFFGTLIWISIRKRSRKFWCGWRDSNPHGETPLRPERSASTNSATSAQNLFRSPSFQSHTLPFTARSKATKQSPMIRILGDCFAPLAMTGGVEMETRGDFRCFDVEYYRNAFFVLIYHVSMFAKRSVGSIIEGITTFWIFSATA
jgi:hypothetical protein